MISLNKAMILGNLTRDPELRYIPSGQAVCNFSVATNRRYKNAQGDLQEDTQYHDVVAWGKVGEIISQIFKKGNKIYLDGRLQTRQWDAPDGSKRSRTEIVLEQFVPLTPKGEPTNYDASIDQTAPSSAPKVIDEDKKKTNKKDAEMIEPSRGEPLRGESPQGEPAASAGGSDEDINLDDIPF